MLRAAAGGLRSRVNTTDDLSFRFSQAPKVYCVKCRTHIYYIKECSGPQGRHAFAPTDRYKVRPDLICPECGMDLCAYMEGMPMIKTDRGWI